MLSTPGRSPRHLPSPPSPSQGRTRDGGEMGPPTVTRQKRQRLTKAEIEVLDEDTFVEAIERIVQRDYFPDLPRLQDRLEWLEAIRTGDPEIIRQAQVRILQRRAERKGFSAGAASGTPSTTAGTPRSISGTPGGLGSIPTPFSLRGTPGGVFGGVPNADIENGDESEAVAAAQRERTNMSLDEFLRTHTSQDNSSFNELKEKENKKRRQKAAAMYLLEDVPSSGRGIQQQRGDLGIVPVTQAGQKLLDDGQKLLTDDGGEELSKGDRKTDGYGSSGQPTSTLKMWPYKAKNALMYDSSYRDDAALTTQELSERAMGPPKEVKYKNTRFRQSEAELQGQQSKQSLEDTVAILYNPVPGETPRPYLDPNGERGSRKHYDLEDFRRTPRSTAAASGAGTAVPSAGAEGKVYDYVSTPSFTPGEGVDASPLMTWGDIEGTPLRLEAEDTPVGIGGSADGPHFKIPEARARDRTAMDMSRSAAKSIKERRQAMAGGPARGFGTPGASPLASPFLGKLGRSPFGAGLGLSPAAQKLVDRAARGKRGGAFDVNLRASYAASPLRSPSVLSRLDSAQK